MERLTTIVLMYHQIVPDSSHGGWVPSSLADADYGVCFRDFRRQMETIRELGVSVLSLSGWRNKVISGFCDSNRRPTLIVTFDDGYESDYDLAAPVLEELEIPATFFISTALTNSPGMLSKEKLLSLARNPLFDLGSHGATHRFLSTLSPEECQRELEESRDRIKEIIFQSGRDPVRHIDLSVPGGRTNPVVAMIARRSGFRSLMTSAPGVFGPGCDLFAIPRLPVMSHHSLENFISLLDPDSFAFRMNRWVRTGRSMAGAILDQWPSLRKALA